MATFERHPNSTKITITGDGTVVSVYIEDVRRFLEAVDRENDLRAKLRTIVLDLGIVERQVEQAVDGMYNVLFTNRTREAGSDVTP